MEATTPLSFGAHVCRHLVVQQQGHDGVPHRHPDPLLGKDRPFNLPPPLTECVPGTLRTNSRTTDVWPPSLVCCIKPPLITHVWARVNHVHTYLRWY